MFHNAPAGLLYPGDAGVPPGTSGLNKKWVNLSPRAGVAWDGKKSVIVAEQPPLDAFSRPRRKTVSAILIQQSGQKTARQFDQLQVSRNRWLSSRLKQLAIEPAGHSPGGAFCENRLGDGEKAKVFGVFTHVWRQQLDDSGTSSSDALGEKFVADFLPLRGIRAVGDGA